MLLFLTLMDLLMSILMVANHLGATGPLIIRLNIVAILFIAGKFILFREDPTMLVDAGIGIYFILLIFGLHFFITWIFLIYLGIKIFLGFMPH